MFNMNAVKVLLLCFCFARFRLVAVKAQQVSDQEICLPLRYTPSVTPYVRQINNTIKTLTVALQRGFMQLDDGWITPLDGFEYKLVTTTQSWQSSRSMCQRMGGDLATNGVQNWVTRRIIFDALRARHSVHFWIGLEDNGHEGSFRWVNGRSTSTRQTALWEDGQPGGGSRENCALISSSNLFTHDYPCSFAFHALCQKSV